MTPHEFFLLSEGALKHEEDAWERFAQLASWLLSAWVDNAPSADYLMGREKARAFFGSKEEFREHMRNKDK